MKRALSLLLKFAVTIAIFVGIFLEFGGGYAPVTTSALRAPDAFAVANPAPIPTAAAAIRQSA